MAKASAIDIHLPELAGLIDRWRVPTTGAAAPGMPPHITLLYPWRPAPLQPTDLVAAAAAVAGARPFRLALHRLGRFPGALFLRPEPDDALRALMRRLAAAFPDTAPYGGTFDDPIPHLTVAKAAAERELDRLEAEIAAVLHPAGPFATTVRELAVGEEGADGRWSVRSTITLKGEPSREPSPNRDIADAAEQHLAVIRLHSEGWPVKSIAAYLDVSRQQVYSTLRRWIAEGVAGLGDKSRARHDVPLKVTLPLIATVKELQENPRLGEFRVAAALRQQGIIVSPRTCGRILANTTVALRRSYCFSWCGRWGAREHSYCASHHPIAEVQL